MRKPAFFAYAKQVQIRAFDFATYEGHFESTVKIVLTTTRIERPPVFNDHFETRRFLLLFVIGLSDPHRFSDLRPHF